MTPETTQTALADARLKRRRASASTWTLFGLVALIAAAAALFRLTDRVLVIANMTIALGTLLLIRHQIDVAVHHIEHAEASQARMDELTTAIARLAGALGAR